MTPAQVIVAATSNAARVLKLDDLGTIAAGRARISSCSTPTRSRTSATCASSRAVYLRGQALDRAGMRAALDSNAQK